MRVLIPPKQLDDSEAEDEQRSSRASMPVPIDQEEEEEGDHEESRIDEDPTDESNVLPAFRPFHQAGPLMRLDQGARRSSSSSEGTAVASGDQEPQARPSVTHATCEGKAKAVADLTQALDEMQEFIELLKERGLELKPMLGDGNCLFRSVSQQLFGDPDMHMEVRRCCMDFMEKDQEHFSQFVTENFPAYIARKRMNGVYGNNVEIQAISEVFNRPVEVYTYYNGKVEVMNIFHGNYQSDYEPIRLSYHGGNHYNAVLDPSKPTVGVGLGLPGIDPASAEKEVLENALKESDILAVEDDLLKATDLEAMEHELEQAILRESLKDYETSLNKRKRNRSPDAGSSSSLASSSAADKGWQEDPMSFPPSVQELVYNGFPSASVYKAYHLVGDNIEAMLSVLLASGSADDYSSPSSASRGQAKSPLY